VTHSMIRIAAEPVATPELREISARDWHGAMVISPNAAMQFDHQLRAADLSWPLAKWFAVGPSTARGTARLSKQAVTCPWRVHSSEALIELPELKSVNAQRWLIIKGRGGRQLLADTLRARGAEVTPLDVYQRHTERALDATLISQWCATGNTIGVTSAEQLTAFLASLPQNALSWVATCHWVVPSERLAQLLPRAIQQITVTDSAADFALVESLQARAAKHQ